MIATEGIRARMGRLIDEYCSLDTELQDAENTNYRVCIFGSARIKASDPLYETVFRLARQVAEQGMDVVTGGGPGLMEAANAGGRAAQGEEARSYGLTLQLPGLDEPPNPHLDIKSMHRRFSSRLDEFVRLSHAVVVAPGGIGTLLELMYVWQLLQLHMLGERPILLLDRSFWQGFLDWSRGQQLGLGFVSRSDYAPIHVVDTPEEAMAILRAHHAGYRPSPEVERIAFRQTRGLATTR
jgi:uncharacterized protein (TIGR00730 family)